MGKYIVGTLDAAAFCRATCGALAVLALALASPASHAQTAVQKFDSRGHPKSQGIALTVAYPSGWEAHEGVTPDSIQRFSGTYKDAYAVMLISLRTIDKPVEDDCRNIPPQEASTAFSAPGAQLFVRNISKITHESKPGFLLDLLQKYPPPGTDVYLQAMAVCTGQKIVMLMCSPVKIDRVRGKIVSSPAVMEETQALCADYFGSLKLAAP